MDGYQVRVNATRIQIEHFKESILWQDIKNELDFWAEGLDKERESLPDRIVRDNLSSAAAIVHYVSIDERKSAIKYFKGILDVFLDILEERKNDSERERADRPEDG